MDWCKTRLFGCLLKVRPTILVHFLKPLLGIKRVVIQNNDGRFYVDYVSHFGQVLVTQGLFEPETRRTIKQNLPPGGTFIDIGANEGYFSVIAAKQVGSTGRVISIEPQKRLIPIIEENARLNECNNIEVLNVAVSDKDMATTRIWLSPSTVSGSSSVVNKYFVAKPQRISSRSLDSLFKELSVNKAHLIKIDVEGFEPEVIHSASALLKSHRIDQVLIDFYLPILQKRGINPEDIHMFLETLGYRHNSQHFTRRGYNLYEKT